MKNTEIKLVNIEEEDDYNNYFFDILNDGQTVGRAIVTASDEDDDHAYCELLAVDEEFRNQGIGTEALYELSSKWCGIEIAPDNEDAKRLYERLGYESDWDDAVYVDQGFGVYRI